MEFPSLRKRKESCSIAARWGFRASFPMKNVSVLQQLQNVQNDRLLSSTVPKCAFGNGLGWNLQARLPQIFIEKAVKVNAIYHRAEFWRKRLSHVSGQCLEMLQQDEVPSHTANFVQRWCRDNLVDFLAKDEWLPNSPDLYPLDYFV